MRYSTAALLSLAATVLTACASSQVPPMAAAASAAPSNDALADFEWRRVHAGGGSFLRGESLHAQPDASLVSVLRMQLPGFTTARGARLAVSAAEPCSLETYVNGLWAPEAENDLRARDVEAVEYYEATTAPPRYRRGGHACPVLLVWLTR